MTFAAEIVVRDNGGTFEAGFASRTNGVKVRSFGKWFGSQMSYRPFREAKQAAQDLAADLNAKARPVQEVAAVEEMK